MASRVFVLALGLLAMTPAFAGSRAAGQCPEATAWSPTGTDVPLEAPIVITWSLPMNGSSVEEAFTLSAGTTTWNGSAFEWAHSAAPPWTSVATPREPLPRLTYMVAMVLPTARDAVNGNMLDQNRNGTGGEPGDELQWSFFTESGTPPRVLATIPPGGATGVPVAANLTITFDEPMNTTSVAAAFGIMPANPGEFAWNANRTQARFHPQLYMTYGTLYRVRLDGSVAKEANGRPLDGNGDGTGGDDYAFSFTTQPDLDAPRVLAETPARGAGSVSVTTNVGLLFSEPMNRTSVEEAFSYGDGTTTWNASAGAFAWGGRTFPDDAATFNPFQNLPFGATINVTVSASMAKDLAGFLLDGNGNGRPEGSPKDDFAWTFVTEPVDRTPPRVAAVDPRDGATGVLETTAVTLTFSEAMNRTTVADAFTLRDPVRSWTKADGSFTWGPGQDVVTYTPSTTLSFDSEYRVTLAGTAADINGNALGPSFSSSFHTRSQPDTSPPRVVSTIPKAGETRIARNPVLSVTFDDPMDTARTEGAVSLVSATGAEPTPIPLGGFEWDAANHTVSFRPLVALDWDTLHRLSVSQAARDEADLPLPTPYSLAFRTAPWSGRAIGRVVDGGASVAAATVTLGNQTTQSSSGGTFSFPNVVAGTYNLTVTKIGYVPKRLSVTLDQHVATADGTIADLGTIALERQEGVSPVLVLATLGLALAAVVAVGLLLRRRRGPPSEAPEEFEDWEDEAAEMEG